MGCWRDWPVSRSYTINSHASNLYIDTQGMTDGTLRTSLGNVPDLQVPLFHRGNDPGIRAMFSRARPE